MVRVCARRTASRRSLHKFKFHVFYCIVFRCVFMFSSFFQLAVLNGGAQRRRAVVAFGLWTRQQCLLLRSAHSAFDPNASALSLSFSIHFVQYNSYLHCCLLSSALCSTLPLLLPRPARNIVPDSRILKLTGYAGLESYDERVNTNAREGERERRTVQRREKES